MLGNLSEEAKVANLKSNFYYTRYLSYLASLNSASVMIKSILQRGAAFQDNLKTFNSRRIGFTESG